MAQPLILAPLAAPKGFKDVEASHPKVSPVQMRGGLCRAQGSAEYFALYCCVQPPVKAPMSSLQGPVQIAPHMAGLRSDAEFDTYLTANKAGAPVSAAPLPTGPRAHRGRERSLVMTAQRRPNPGRD